MIEADRGERLVHAANALRLAMLAVLGPRSINEDKFSTWSTRLTVLGLEWDTVKRTVSMPEVKITKALLRLDDVMRTNRATKHQLSKLLGSLRHVCSCIRPAKPFYQRVVALWRRAPPFRSIEISTAAATDLRWFQHILVAGRLRSVPTSFFCDLPTPDVHLYMDASNTGLCVLHPAAQEYLRVQFDQSEQLMIQQCRAATSDNSFSINVREQLSAVLALLVWGATWSAHGKTRLVHVRCWVDNSSAVSWCNSLSSRNSLSQELNRIIGAVEAQFGIRVSAEHIPGSRNSLADLGSRAWEGPSLSRWSNSVRSWHEQAIPKSIRKIYNGRSSPFSSDPSPTHLAVPTSPRGGSGARTDCRSGSRCGYLKTTQMNNRYSWLRSPFMPPAMSNPTVHDQPLKPFAPSSAILAGIIASDSEDVHACTKAISSLSAASVGYNRFRNEHNVNPSPLYRVLFGAAVLGFFFLLRSAEYLAIDGARHAYALEVRDVETRDDAGRRTSVASAVASVTVRFRGGKTDRYGVGLTRSLKRSNEAPVCPVFAALLLLANAQALDLADDAPLCTLPNRRMVTAKLMNSVLRLAATTTDTRGPVSTHSLRIGGATALFQGGASELTIKHHGRWRSNAFNRYTRLTEPHGQGLTRNMMESQQHA